MSGFPVEMESIINLINAVDPKRYAGTRNYINGSVTRLSPFISRGVISTRQVLESLINRGFTFNQVEKLVQELAWRDYYQRVWQSLGDQINRDIKQPQDLVNHFQLPSALPQAATGIEAVDDSIRELFETGYMHNHCRMYLAGIACNVGRAHWLKPARWMYYHLLDGDWASNALSWQWVAGSFSSKKYVANQENINKYTSSSQKKSFLDISYEQFPIQEIPASLQKTDAADFTTNLPLNQPALQLEESQPILLYNYYHLDPLWRKGEEGNRVLLLEPEIFEAYPISDACLNFMLSLAGQIPGTQLLVGSFADLQKQAGDRQIIYREHPLNRHYRGLEDPREWMVPEVSGYHPSFFSYWKKVERVLRKKFN